MKRARMALGCVIVGLIGVLFVLGFLAGRIENVSIDIFENWRGKTMKLIDGLKARMKTFFVDDIKATWTKFSTIALLICTTLQAMLELAPQYLFTLWLSVPQEFKEFIGPDIKPLIGKVLLVVLLWGTFGRFVRQAIAKKNAELPHE